MTMLEKAKLVLRITTEDFDDEIKDLIDAAKADLGIAGVINVNETDPLIIRAVLTYVKCHFGDQDDFDRYSKAYDSMKAQLMTATGYTHWERRH